MRLHTLQPLSWNWLIFSFMYRARIALENYVQPRVAFQFTHGDQIISLVGEWEKKKGKQKHKKNYNTAIKCAVCVEEVATAKLVSLFISQIALTRQRWSSSIFSFILLPPSWWAEENCVIKNSAVVCCCCNCRARREREGSGEKSESE